MKYSVFGIHSELYNSQRNTLIIKGLGSTKYYSHIVPIYLSTMAARGRAAGAQTFGRHSDYVYLVFPFPELMFCSLKM